MSVKKAKLTPWQKIMRAAKRGTGLRLTADECSRLGMDGAIETRATLDYEEQGAFKDEESTEARAGKSLNWPD